MVGHLYLYNETMIYNNLLSMLKIRVSVKRKCSYLKVAKRHSFNETTNYLSFPIVKYETIFSKCPDGGTGRHEGETMYIVESLLEWKRSRK